MEIEEMRVVALAKFLDCETDDISVTKYSDTEFDAPGGEYLVLTDDEADEKCREQIEESLWAFNAEFIVENSPLPYEAVEMIKSFQKDKCEGANETIKAIVGDMRGFCEAAISADGRGHFMSPYDGNENEETVEGTTFYIYRTN